MKLCLKSIVLLLPILFVNACSSNQENRKNPLEGERVMELEDSASSSPLLDLENEN